MSRMSMSYGASALRRGARLAGTLLAKTKCSFQIQQCCKSTAALKPIKYINDQMLYFNSVVRNRPANMPDWSSVKSELLTKRGDINAKNINAVMLKMLVNTKNYDTALSLVKYLKETEEDHSLGTINSILKLYYFIGMENKLTNENIEYIRSTYKILYAKYKVLDGTTCDCLLHALAVAGDWQDCLKVLEDIKYVNTPTHSAYSTVISTLFQNDLKDEAKRFIDQSLGDSRSLMDKVYEHWIEYILRNFVNDKEKLFTGMEEINTFIAGNCVRISKNVADKISEVYISHLKWNGNHTDVSVSGKCHSCKNNLEHIKLSPDEFSLLQNNFKERVLIGKDVFLKTHPKELTEFVEFIERTAPYDIVLDALNIAYSTGKSSTLEKLKFLDSVVSYFLEKNKKIMLLGRQHMLKWPKGRLNFLMKNTKCFFTNDLSQDDPFFLTAAIFSGPKTDFLSRDKLRGHRFLLHDEKLRSIFLRWQWEHQWVQHVKHGNQPSIQMPLRFAPCAQRNVGWHIPYEMQTAYAYEDYMNSSSPTAENWLCLQPPGHE